MSRLCNGLLFIGMNLRRGFICKASRGSICASWVQFVPDSQGVVKWPARLRHSDCARRPWQTPRRSFLVVLFQLWVLPAVNTHEAANSELTHHMTAQDVFGQSREMTCLDFDIETVRVSFEKLFVFVLCSASINTQGAVNSNSESTNYTVDFLRTSALKSSKK